MPCPRIARSVTSLPQAPPERLIALQPDLQRQARHLTGNPDAAQDLCQDVMLKLWIKLRAGEDITDLRAYAMMALRNGHRQTFRYRQPDTELDDDMQITGPGVFAQLALKELERAIARLPEDQARLIRMVAAGETSPADLAQITGWPLGTVMSRLARARAQLRTEMGLTRSAPVAELI